MLANYHTHTRWCHHGTGEIEDYLEAALKAGLKEIAITEHVPHRDDLDPKRIQWEDFPAYDAALNTAIRQYEGRIHILKGFECEYYPEEMEDYERFRKEYGYQLMFLGQHRSGPHREIDNFAPKGERELELYADEVTRGIGTGFFDFLAHPDLVLQGYGPWDGACERAMRRIFAACEQFCVPIELNGNGVRGGKDYPAAAAFLLSKEYRLEYLVNSDAHQPQFLYDEVIKKTEQLAADLGLTVLERVDFGKRRAERSRSGQRPSEDCRAACGASE